MYPGVFIVNFIVNISDILHNMKIAEKHTLYWKKERKVSLTDCKLKFFSEQIQK